MTITTPNTALFEDEDVSRNGPVFERPSDTGPAVPESASSPMIKTPTHRSVRKEHPLPPSTRGESKARYMSHVVYSTISTDPVTFNQPRRRKGTIMSKSWLA